jgi:hypothetical protein
VNDIGVDYSSYFTIEEYDSLGFSNSLSDTALKTFSRIAPHSMAGYKGGQEIGLSDYVYSIAYATIDMLGFRMTADVTPWTRVATKEAARLYADMELNKANAEARNLGIQVVPKFGLMVNRPVYWRKRNYVANIVNLQHSITANSACGTTINMNYGRAWTGKLDDSKGREIFEHLGGRMRLNYANFVADTAVGWVPPEAAPAEATKGSGDNKTVKTTKRAKAAEAGKKG